MSLQTPPPGTAIILRKKNFLANDPNVDIPAEVVRPVGATILVRLVDENKESYIPTKWFTSKASNLACVPPIVSLPHYFQIQTTDEADAIFKHPLDNPPIVEKPKPQPSITKPMQTQTPLIYKNILAVMKSVEAIGKTQTAADKDFAFRGIDDIANALHPLFKENSIFITTEVLSHQINNNGKTIVNAKFTFHTSDGSSVSSTVTGESQDKGEHGTAKALSYALKTALVQMFLIPVGEKDDREWLAQTQFQKALLRINGGDKELLPKLQKEFRIKADHLKMLQDADKKQAKK